MYLNEEITQKNLPYIRRHYEGLATMWQQHHIQYSIIQSKEHKKNQNLKWIWRHGICITRDHLVIEYQYIHKSTSPHGYITYHSSNTTYDSMSCIIRVPRLSTCVPGTNVYLPTYLSVGTSLANYGCANSGRVATSTRPFQICTKSKRTASMHLPKHLISGGTNSGRSSYLARCYNLARILTTTTTGSKSILPDKRTRWNGEEQVGVEGRSRCR